MLPVLRLCAKNVFPDQSGEGVNHIYRLGALYREHLICACAYFYLYLLTIIHVRTPRTHTLHESSYDPVWEPEFDRLEDMIKDAMEDTGTDYLRARKKVRSFITPVLLVTFSHFYLGPGTGQLSLYNNSCFRHSFVHK